MYVCDKSIQNIYFKSKDRHYKARLIFEKETIDSGNNLGYFVKQWMKKWKKLFLWNPK